MLLAGSKVWLIAVLWKGHLFSELRGWRVYKLGVRQWMPTKNGVDGIGRRVLGAGFHLHLLVLRTHHRAESKHILHQLSPPTTSQSPIPQLNTT